MITAEQLKKICPNLKLERATTLAELINKVCPKYNINNPARLQAFIAQIAHESGGFTIKQENMNYTTPARLVAIWPSRFNLTGEGGKANANNYVRSMLGVCN